MTDLSNTIVPKSDQLNADDFIAGPRIINVTSVKVVSGDQPISIYYENDDGKPWKPCKSMRRVLIAAWGSDGDAYIGRSIQLFNDSSVKWAGQAVGGIRISHLSDIANTLVLPLTTTRGKRSPYKIEKLEPKPTKSIEDMQTDCLKTLEDKGYIPSKEQVAKVMATKSKAELTLIYKEITK